MGCGVAMCCDDATGRGVTMVGTIRRPWHCDGCNDASAVALQRVDMMHRPWHCDMLRAVVAVVLR